MSQRAIAKKLGISRQTVKKYGEGETIPGNRKTYNRQPGVISPEVIRFIQSCFDADANENLSKQKHTAKRIYARLVKEMDFNGGESTIRAIVSSLRSNYTVPPQAMMPLSYAPGEAMQIDWGGCNGLSARKKEETQHLLCPLMFQLRYLRHCLQGCQRGVIPGSPATCLRLFRRCAKKSNLRQRQGCG